MRHGTSSRRQRSRNNGNRNSSQQRTQVYDSNGPDVRIRGTAHQVAEKYLALAKDSTSVGNLVIAENYYQHAEHYIRIINENNGKFDSPKPLEKGAVREDSGNRIKSVKKPNAAQDDLSLPSSIVAAPVKKREQEVEAVG